MKKIKAIISFLMVYGILAGILESTIYCTIAGKVIDEETGKGIAGVVVYLVNQTSKVTDKNGNFLFTNVYPATYILEYAVPFPYVAKLGDRDKLEHSVKDFVTLVKGEYKKVTCKLKKGGAVKGQIRLEGVNILDNENSGVDIMLYKVEADAEKYKDPSMKTEGIYHIDATNNVAENGRYEIVGLPEGKIIIVVSGAALNPTGERVYYPGKLKIVDVMKEQWTENVDISLVENKAENANLKIEVFSSFNNQMINNTMISIERIERLWGKDYFIGVDSSAKSGEGGGNVYFTLESGRYLVSVSAFKNELDSKERLILGENWDNKKIEVEITNGQIVNKKVYISIKLD